MILRRLLITIKLVANVDCILFVISSLAVSEYVMIDEFSCRFSFSN